MSFLVNRGSEEEVEGKENVENDEFLQETPPIGLELIDIQDTGNESEGGKTQKESGSKFYPSDSCSNKSIRSVYFIILCLSLSWKRTRRKWGEE